MIDLILKTTVVFALAALTNVLLRRASAALRHSIWMLAFAAVVVVALFPRLTADVVPAISVTAIGGGIGRAGAPAFDYLGAFWLRAIWIGGTAVLLARLAISFVWLHYKREELDGPVTFGILRPEVLLPKSSTSWPAETMNSVMLHEQAHIARYDTIAQLFAQIVCAVLWFQPLAWYGARRAAEERERAADDLVIGRGVPAALYAGHLLEIARQAQSIPAAAIPMSRAASLEGRLRAVLDASTIRTAVTPRRRVAVLLAAALLIPGISALRAQGPVHKAGEAGLTNPKLVTKVEPKYTQEARDAKVQGTVILELEIDTEGHARNIKVKTSLDQGLDLNAVAAVDQWVFAPAIKDGQPVVCAAVIEVNFRLL